MSSCYQSPVVAVSLCLCLLQGAVRGQSEADSSTPPIELRAKHVLKLENRPSSFSFSRDGKRFACNDGRSARVWDTTTWKQLACFTDEKQLIHHAILSPGGRSLAFTRDVGNDIHLLDVASGKVLRTLSGRSLGWLTFSPDGKAMVSADHYYRLQLWDVETGKDLCRFTDLQDRFTTNYKRIWRLVFSPDGSTLAVAREDGVVHLLDVQKGKDTRQLTPPDPALNSPNGLAFSPDGRFLAVGSSRELPIIIWDVRAGKPVRQLRWPVDLDRGENFRLVDRGRVQQRPSGIWTLAFTADSRSLIAGCNGDWLRVWEVATGGLRYEVKESVALLAVARASTLFATARGGAETRHVSIWDSRTCVPPHRTSAPIDLGRVWSDLVTNDTALAFERMRDLPSVPKEAVAALDKYLPTVDPVKASTIEGLIRELDDDRFEVRDRAQRRLGELGKTARAALSEAIARNPSPEAGKRIKELLDALDAPPTGERLRIIRAVEVLETIGSPEACRVLKRVAGGDPGALLTREAKSALDRLDAN